MNSYQWGGFADEFDTAVEARFGTADVVRGIKGNVSDARQRWAVLDLKFGKQRSFLSRLFLPDFISKAEHRWVLLDSDLRDSYQHYSLPVSGKLTGPVSIYTSRKLEKKRGGEGLRASIPFLIMYSTVHAAALAWLDWPNNKDAWAITYRFLQDPLSEKTPITTFITAITLASTWEDFEMMLDLPGDLLETMLVEALTVRAETQPHPAPSTR